MPVTRQPPAQIRTCPIKAYVCKRGAASRIPATLSTLPGHPLPTLLQVPPHVERAPRLPWKLIYVFTARIMSADPNQLDDTVEHQRRIQAEQDARDAIENAAKPDESEAETKAEPGVQAGARVQPTEFPAQHLDKPGLEADLEMQPRFQAPDYRGSAKLAGFGTLITGGDSGIGRAVAVLFAREGADVAIAYHHSDQDAHDTRRHVEAEGGRCILLKGDVKDADWCRDAVAQTVKAFGRLDVLVNNAAFQEHADSLLETSTTIA